MSDFQIHAWQRRRLLEHDYRPLTYEGWSDEAKDPKPSGCEPGARYVLAWRRKFAVTDRDDRGVVFPAKVEREPVWFITVKSTVRRREGGWLVLFDVTDLRDRGDFLRPGGGYQQGRDPLGAGRVPDPEWLDSEAEAISEFWDKERGKKFEAQQRERSRQRRQRAA